MSDVNEPASAWSTSDAEMDAVVAPTPGGPDALTLVRRPRPIPRDGEVVIAVEAAGVNRPDILQRQGLYPPPPGASDVLGLEVAGVVAAVGPSVEGAGVGDRVCALLSGGGYAGFACARAEALLRVPDALPLRQAAALPEALFTVWTNVFERGALKPGETLLVHGGSSGIGVIAIQLAAALGARVIATAGSEEKRALCRELGAEIAINYRTTDFTEPTRAAGGADVILDMVGGDYVARNLSVLKPDGRLVQIAFLNGARVELDLLTLMLKRQTLTGSTLRARPDPEKARLAEAVRRSAWPLVLEGRVRAVIDSAFPLADATKAHARMESGAHAGKILLLP